MRSKTKRKNGPPLLTVRNGSVLDWPGELGLGRDFAERVEARCRKDRRRRRALTGAAAGLAILLIVFGAVPYVRDTATVEAPVAQRRTVRLPDGSLVELNAGAQIHTDFRYRRRVVSLSDGEAFFTVAKDAAHPFLVETAAGVVRVTGTEFDVRAPGGREMTVTLVHGAVVVETPAAPVSLVPGQQFTSGGGVRRLSEDELAGVIAWRRGRFAFDGLTLAEAAARLGEYHGKHITVAPEIAGLRAHGSYPVDDLPAVLNALQTALSVRVLPAGDGSYRIVARQSGGSG
ncbi:MAG: FecR domain-containing protein [Lacunisphaera sp.]